MSDIYVIIGNAKRKEEGKTLPVAPPGMLELWLESEVLDDTYGGFVKECTDICEESYDSLAPEQTLVYDLMQRSLANGDASVAYKFFAFDRDNKKGDAFIIDDNVKETAGEFMYSSAQEKDDGEVQAKTLEVYILEKDIGG
ncbi:hypothetical protein GOV10_01610 [Candidatus Woesearchaeota archaeon]|nr:hypothetical protein [Candidatus Woesearchaeota archaeon]